MSYFLHILILIGIYVILASSLNLIAGYTGVLSVAQAAFYGLGAYTAALMALKFHSPFLVNLLCAMIFCGLLGTLVAIPSLRIRGDYFVIATFAFQMIAFSILNNWVSFTGGPMGLPGIARPAIVGWKINSDWEYLLLVAGLVVIVLWACRQIVHSPFGRVLMAIREDETFVLSAGKNVAAYKMLVFAIGGGMASVAGVLHAHYVEFIDPTSFTVMESIFIISIMVIGGEGSSWGPLAGPVVLVTLGEMLRFIGLPSSVAASVRQILYGGLLVAFMMRWPRGLMGSYDISKGVVAK